MSDSGLQFKGRPNTEQEERLRVLRYCGGSGAGACVDTLGVTGLVLVYRVPKHIVYNRKIIFRNLSIRIYTDAGPAGFCSHSTGTEVSWWFGLSADPNLTIETIAKTGVQLSGAPPYEIEFDATKCPQPTDTAWENYIYAYLWWGDAGYIDQGSVDQTELTVDDLQIIKHDYDIKI